MSNTIVGAQLYTVREFAQTPQAIAETFKKVRQIGYQAVQASGLGPIEPKELRKIADGEGIKIAATHVDFDKLAGDVSAMVDMHRAYGCEHVAIGSMPGYARDGAKSVTAFARKADEVGKKLAEAGMSFSYHNHEFEFQNLGGKRMLEILMENSDPRYFKLELDTYWVQFGGGDPAAWIDRYNNRIVLLHLKDMGVSAEHERIMAEVGEGNLNWPAILRSARGAGVVWYLVEQDTCQRDPFESLAISLRNLKTMGIC